MKQRLKKHKRFQRALSRKVTGSCNRKKAVRRIALQHRKVANQRANTCPQLTSQLAKTKSVVVIEDLGVSGMLKNHHLAQAIANVGFYEFKRQLLYKASWYGCRVVLADRWEPSSKRCSGCAACGQIMDRDLNAAINFSTLAGSSSETDTPRGLKPHGFSG